MKIYLFLVLAGFLLISCQKDEDPNPKDKLIAHDWKQVNSLNDTASFFLKQFYSIHFSPENASRIILDYLGVSGVPDPVTLDTIGGRYEFDGNQMIISFPEPLDTTYLLLPDTTTMYVYFENWKIIQLTDELLVVEPITRDSFPYLPAFVTGVSPRYYFRPID
jgi:hypothetical protein